jgi:CheY-like chemotaxis protein
MIAVTGYGAETDLRKIEEAGFDDHMTKPSTSMRCLRAWTTRTELPERFAR